MEVLDAVRKRRSIRRFKRRDIPDEITEKFIEALIQAPSAGNLQSRKFYFVTDQDCKDQLSKAALNQNSIKEAPLVITGCADMRIAERYGQRGVDLYTVQDVACSLMSMMLVAAEAGLGTVWVGAFHEDSVAEVLNLPSHLSPVAIVPTGWPERVPSPTPRITREEAVVWIRNWSSYC